MKLNTLNESSFRMNSYCVKSTSLFGKTFVIDKVLKLVGWVIKPLQRQKNTWSFSKILENHQWNNSLTLILIFQIPNQKPVVFFFTDVYEKIHKNFQRTSRWLFFLQVSELNNKLDELSLKGWIHPCPRKAAF